MLWLKLSAVVMSVGGWLSADVVGIAESFLNKPYHWGCKNPNSTYCAGNQCGLPCAGGFDCTGLVQYSYAQVGVKLSAAQQYLPPNPVTIITDSRCATPSNCTLQELLANGILQPGDLLWFDSRTAAEGYDPAHKVTGHVGIYESGITMINAFSDVLNAIGMGIRRDDLLNAQPPINPGYWTQRFMFAGRVSICPLIPEPGDTSFPANVAIPTFTGPAGPNSTACQLYRHFNTVTIQNNQFNGFSNYQFLFRCGDVFDVWFTAQDDTYVLTQPDLGLSGTIPKGGMQRVQFSSGCPFDRTLNIIIQNSSGVQSLPGSFTITSCCQ